MNEPAKFNNVVSFLWAIADLLNGAFKKSEFQKIILPFTVLGQLCRAGGYAFYNTSKFNYESLLRDDANLALNLRQYVMCFSPNVREIFAAFNFDEIREIQSSNLATFPGQLFSSTQIPVCLWFLAKNNNADAKLGFRDRRKAMLFISNTSSPMLDQQPGMIDLWNN